MKSSSSPARKARFARGTSVLELLTVLATLSSVLAIAVVALTNTGNSAKEVKLHQDVAALNRALKTYVVSGGDLTLATSGAEAITKLKSVLRTSSRASMAGLRGNMIDHRLRGITATDPGLRATWNNAQKSFTVSEEGPGFSGFVLEDETIPTPQTEEARNMVLKLNTSDKWIWSFGEQAGAARAPASAPTADPTTPASGNGLDDDLIVLQPPSFSIPSGSYKLNWYSKKLTLTPYAGTPAGVSEIVYLISGGQWERYSGPFDIYEPGLTITAKTIPLDPDHYLESAEVASTYTTTPVLLDPDHNLTRTYTYAALGGLLYPGSPAPVLAPAPGLALKNGNDIPDEFEASRYFQSFWTWDGSSPATPGIGRYSGISSFQMGYPGDSLNLTPSTFGSGDSVTLNFTMVSKNPAIFASSPVKTVTATVTRTALSAPVVTPGDGSLTGGEKISMFPNLTSSQTPAGIRIYYRIDGTDPGEINGDPLPGATLYTAPFNLEATNSPSVRVVARLYPPLGFKQWFTSSPATVLNYFLPYADANVYGVLGGTKDIYNLNPSTGSNRVFTSTAPYNLRALALDAAKARIYYVEEAAANWSIGYYDILNGTHSSLGRLSGGTGYSPALQPQNLAFFNGDLFYIPDRTDDLVRIALTADATGIASRTKIADLRNNSKDWVVGDLAVDETGLLFFVDDGRKYHRYDLTTLSGYLEMGSASEFYAGLAFFQGRLFGAKSGDSRIHRIAPTSGQSLATVSAMDLRRFIDFASPSSATLVSPTKSLWAIDAQIDGQHLIEFRNNYRSPLVSTAVDYGVLYCTDKKLPEGVRSLAITHNGMAYMVLSKNLTPQGGSLTRRGLVSLNLATLKLGDPLRTTMVGDLFSGLQTAVGGKLDPDDVVSGITFSPDGKLYGVIREGETTNNKTSADYLFCCTQPVSSMAAANIAVQSLGRLSSAVATATDCEDLVFMQDGRLMAVDAHDNEVLEISKTNGSVLSVLSQDAGRYHGMAVDIADNRLIGSDLGGTLPGNLFRMINGGANNDETYLNYFDRWGYDSIEAISFFQGPFNLLGAQVDLFAVNGSRNIYGIDFETGQTVGVTDAPWPVRALATDVATREVFYLRGDGNGFLLGSFNQDTFEHKLHGDLKNPAPEYIPNYLPDNLMGFGGYLWYIESRTDNLIRVKIKDGAIFEQIKVSNLMGNSFRFDLIGDLALANDGWMYFSAIRPDGQLFCRYNINTLSQFEIISGPVPSPVLLPDGESYRENWFDALAFGRADSSGKRTLYGTYASTPAPLHIVNSITGENAFARSVLPSLNLIDFSDQHPGVLANPSAVTLQPLLKLLGLQSAYSYADVGGPFLTGTNPAPPVEAGPSATLVNPFELMLSLQNSSHFEVRWSYDGIDPRTSPQAQVTGAFTDGFPGQTIAINYSLWGSRSTLPLKVVAKSLKPNVMVDSPLLAPAIAAERTALPNPQISETAAVNGVRQIQIKADVDSGMIPPGTRIYYTIDGTDPGVARDANGLDNPVSGMLYTGTIPIPATGSAFTVNTRLYPPTNLPQWFGASSADYIFVVPVGIEGGHFDLDTSSMLYPFRRGSTDGHVHAYDKAYNVVGANYFDLKTPKLHNLPVDIPAGTRFKIIISNPDLSPGGRLVINKAYNPSDDRTFIKVMEYTKILPSDLPVYSLEGLAGTTQLTQFGLYFDMIEAGNGGLIKTVTGAVRSNAPGLLGEWRNGALTVQVVRVNANGTDAFKADTSYSNGGLQGTATSGLLWESTIFYHGNGGPYGN